MIPYVHIEPLRIGPLAIQPFGLLVALGVLVGVALAARRARRLGMDVAALQSFITWTLVAGHVLDTIFYHPRDPGAAVERTAGTPSPRASCTPQFDSSSTSFG